MDRGYQTTLIAGLISNDQWRCGANIEYDPRNPYGEGD
jgi:hypothetical protein